LAGLEARLAALSPQATLARGYAIVRRTETGELVRSVAQVGGGDALSVRVEDGEFGAVVKE
jgi:exodeoxyribonuclease VII large subunit